MKYFVRMTLVAVAVTITPLAARAQAVFGGSDLTPVGQSSLFSRDRNVSVRERPRPEYQAAGVQLGSFWLFPRLEGNVEYNDNIYATTIGTVSDEVFRVKPSLVLQSNWSRHYLELYANATFNQYATHTTENTTDWIFGSNGRLDIVRGSDITFGASGARLTEPRTSAGTPTAAVSPVQYYLGAAYVGAEHEVDRLKFTAKGTWNNYNYLNVPAVGGGVIDENFRDMTGWGAMGRADYAISPDTAAFVEIDGSWHDYRLPGAPGQPSRTSSGYEALAGVNFDITHTVRGEIGLGYLNQSFKSSFYQDVAGFGARAKVEWFPTQLTTVTASASRSEQDSAIAGAGGYLSTNLGLQVDHEFLRNLILSANGTYGEDDYSGLSRTDHRYGFGVNATYLLNRRVGVNAGYTYYRQTSDGTAAGPAFTVNRVMGGLVLQF
jgi:hypothetical protein